MIVRHGCTREKSIIISVIEEKAVLAALRKFAGAVTAKMTSVTAGEPEDQLRVARQSASHGSQVKEFDRLVAFLHGSPADRNQPRPASVADE
jgi:hypothetical protein